MIEFRNVSKSFLRPDGRSVAAVSDLSFEIRTGETLCLIGTSGCGKTTSMKLINRLLEPSSGQVVLDGADVRTVDVIQLRRRIGYVIQNGALFPHLSVSQNVGLLCEIEGRSAAQTERRVHELLELVNLDPREFAPRYPLELSGGQQQRVGVARALALDPEYVLMDEPFGALDPITRHQLQGEFIALKQRVRKTVVFVTHDLSEAARLGDRLAIMDEGRLVQLGTLDELQSQPANEFVARFVSESPGLHG